MGAGFILTFWSGLGQTVFIGVSNDAVKAQFDLSDGEWGEIYMYCTIASAVMLSQFGKIVDHWSVQVAAISVTIGLVVSCLLMAWADSLILLVVALIGLRLFGQGMMGHVAIVAAGRWFRANRGRALSLVSLGYPISQALLPAAALLVMPIIGYTQTWVLAALVLAAVALPSLLGLLSKEREPRSNKVTTDDSEISWRRKDVLRLPEFYLLVVFVLHAAFAMTAFFFHQQSLMKTQNWSATIFAAALPWFAIAGALSSLVWGRLIDLFSARACLPFVFIPMILGCGLVSLFDGNWVIFAVAGLFGVSVGMSQTSSGALWPELFGTVYLGEIRSTIAPIMVLSTAIAPFITGYGLDNGVIMPTQLLYMAASAGVFSVFVLMLLPRLNRMIEGHQVDLF